MLTLPTKSISRSPDHIALHAVDRRDHHRIADQGGVPGGHGDDLQARIGEPRARTGAQPRRSSGPGADRLSGHGHARPARGWRSPGCQQFSGRDVVQQVQVKKVDSTVATDVWTPAYSQQARRVFDTSIITSVRWLSGRDKERLARSRNRLSHPFGVQPDAHVHLRQPVERLLERRKWLVDPRRWLCDLEIGGQSIGGDGQQQAPR